MHLTLQPAEAKPTRQKGFAPWSGVVPSGDVRRAADTTFQGLAASKVPSRRGTGRVTAVARAALTISCPPAAESAVRPLLCRADAKSAQLRLHNAPVCASLGNREGGQGGSRRQSGSSKRRARVGAVAIPRPPRLVAG